MPTVNNRGRLFLGLGLAAASPGGAIRPQRSAAVFIMGSPCGLLVVSAGAPIGPCRTRNPGPTGIE